MVLVYPVVLEGNQVSSVVIMYAKIPFGLAVWTVSTVQVETLVNCLEKGKGAGELV
jgi:hypothetical protein